MPKFPFKEKLLVTCALPYANGDVHIGHLRTYIPGDVFVRFMRKIGQDVIFICGSDTHGTPIVVNAEKEGVKPEELVAKYHAKFKSVFKKLNISMDHYGSTDSPENHARTQEIVKKLEKGGYIYEKEIDEAYCPKCERSLPDRYLKGVCPYCGAEARGDECDQGCGRFLEKGELKDPVCKICGGKPEFVKRTHKFFKLTEFEEFLEKYLKKLEGTKVAKNYALGWLKGGLKDWCITRDMKWGVKYPGFDKVVYVWVDAPIGYIASTENWAKKTGGDWEEYWKDDAKIIHFIGSEITYHHCIFWPSMLEGAGYNLPWGVVASGMLKVNGKNFSKSRGYVVWLEEDYLERGFDPDAMRYYVVATSPHTRDLDFSWDVFQEKANKELADTLGNFVHRTCLFARDVFDGKVNAGVDSNVKEKIKETEKKMRKAFEKYDFKRAADAAMSLASYGNEFFQCCAPWKKKGSEECEQAIANCMQMVKALAVFMEPFTPDAAQRIWKQIGEKGSVHEVEMDAAYLPVKGKLGKTEVIFPKIEDKEMEEVKKVLDERMEKASGGEVSFEEFSKLDLRVGEVLSVKKVKGSKKLYRLEVEADRKRTLVAGIAEHYSPQELKGKKVVVVVNLEPAVIHGVESEGMLLAAEGEDGLALATLDRELENGAKLC